jgi:hypothetical protein
VGRYFLHTDRQLFQSPATRVAQATFAETAIFCASLISQLIPSHHQSKSASAHQKPIRLALSFAIACTFPLPITNGILQNAAAHSATMRKLCLSLTHRSQM